MAKFAPHMGDPHGDPQTSPQHANPHGLGAFLQKAIQEIHVYRRVVGWSAGRHVDRSCGGGQISPWPARNVTERFRIFGGFRGGFWALYQARAIVLLLPPEPYHIKNTTVILIHYSGGKKNTTVAKQYGRVSDTPCFPGENSQEISAIRELIRR